MSRVTFWRLCFLQLRFSPLGNELPQKPDVALFPLLGESEHPVHIAFYMLLHRNPAMSLTVKFIPRKGQGVCTKIHLLRRASTKKQSKYLQIKDWLSTPWQVHIHGTQCTHEEGATAKDVCDLPQRVGGEASRVRLSTQ